MAVPALPRNSSAPSTGKRPSHPCMAQGQRVRMTSGVQCAELFPAGYKAFTAVITFSPIPGLHSIRPNESPAANSLMYS